MYTAGTSCILLGIKFCFVVYGISSHSSKVINRKTRKSGSSSKHPSFCIVADGHPLCEAKSFEDMGLFD